MRNWLSTALLLTLLMPGLGRSMALADSETDERLLQLRRVSEGVASLCESMTDVTVNLAENAVGLPMIGGGIRMTLAVLGVPDKVDRLRDEIREQNQKVMASIGKMEGELVQIGSQLDEIAKAVEGVRKDIARLSEEELFVKLCAFQKTITDDPPQTPEDLRAYQKELRNLINLSHSMLVYRGREVPFAVAINMAGISLSQLHKLDLTMAPNRYKSLDSRFYRTVSQDVRSLLKTNASKSSGINIDAARAEYESRTAAIKSYASSRCLQAVVNDANSGPVRFMISGEEKYLKRTDVEYSVLLFRRTEIPIYSHRAFTHGVSLDKSRAELISGVPFYQKLRSYDLSGSPTPINNPDGTPATTFYAGRLEEASSEYMNASVAGFNEKIKDADEATTRYILLLSLGKWEQACLKSLDELESSLKTVETPSRK